MDDKTGCRRMRGEAGTGSVPLGNKERGVAPSDLPAEPPTEGTDAPAELDTTETESETP